METGSLPGGTGIFTLNWNSQYGKSQQQWHVVGAFFSLFSSCHPEKEKKKKKSDLQNILTFMHRSFGDMQHCLCTISVPS